MKERKFVLGALIACLVIAAASLAGLAAAKPGKKQAAFKVAWIYPGPHNDGGWSQAHDAGRLRGPEGARRQGADDLQGERVQQRVGAADRRRPRARRLQHDLRHVVRRCSSSASTASSRRSTRRCCSSRRPAPRSRRTSPSTSAPPRTRSTSPAWPRAPRRRRASSATWCPTASPRSSATSTPSRSAPRRRTRARR